MDEKKVREAIKALKITIDIGKQKIEYNKTFEPKNDNEYIEKSIECAKIAIEALEKQVPKKTMHIHVNYGKHLWKKNADGSVDMKAFDGGIHGYAAECERCGSLAFYEELLEDEDCEVDKYYCPSCNCRVPKGENACKCGQLLNWSEAHYNVLKVN